MARSRSAILRAAVEAFLANGYVATNLDTVAAEAGVSKKTIYNVFGDKERLFHATISVVLATAESFSSDVATVLAETRDLEGSLRRIAVSLARTITSEPVIATRRLLIGVATRFPDLVADYHARAPGRVLATLAAAFADLDRREMLAVDDPELAAEHFAFLVVGASLDRAIFGVQAAELGHVHLDRRAERGADAFLRAYRRPGSTQSPRRR